MTTRSTGRRKEGSSGLRSCSGILRPDEVTTRKWKKQVSRPLPNYFLSKQYIDVGIDVAYAAAAIEMRDISGADFRFAKTLTLPFFGSGMVELPPGGTKRVKNSRKMQMVFFVFYGRVTVDLGTPAQRFSIGRGGMWQVPRGKPLFSCGLPC